jgi:hypothetical protein
LVARIQTENSRYTACNFLDEIKENIRKI